ncbi:fungal-specific transcription factor domain-containing protein [Nemania sp. NC0429]|nr:fungal-specific transcription factor domain-containing protein [Nemania sp. NC0429]
MESRGDIADVTSGRRRLAIPRRSCDQCRTRKIGCDRGSPCSNCVSTKLACTFGTVATKATSAKQRVLISTQYERKIDEIAEGLEAVKILLQKSLPPIRQESGDNILLQTPDSITAWPPVPSEYDVDVSQEPAKWDHSTQVSDFVRIVADDRASREDPRMQESDVLASLRRLARALESSDAARDLSFPETRGAKSQNHLPLPPADAAVIVLRWAKEHKSHFRILAVSRILPLDQFTDICQKVCFAVDEYSQLDFIIANSYLSYIFSEYITATGEHGYQDYYRRCRQNAQMALSRLPFLLPASIEAIAALTFGASYAVESSKATLAWTYISYAANLCQTLGLHRVVSAEPGDGTQQETRGSLFWLVYLLEKSLSLRLSRPSNFRDADITIPFPSNKDNRRCAQTARIQGDIYDQLYSPAGLAGFAAQRGEMARALASELRGLIDETKTASQDTPAPEPDVGEDKMRAVYLKMELVKQLALLTLILRAVPAPPDSPTTITDECAAAAYETLEMHQQCMAAVAESKDDVFITERYMNWGILHTPFVPFSVLFTRTVQLCCPADLAYLDRFSESLRPKEPTSTTTTTTTTTTTAESITHPYRLYNLLCQAAHLYIRQSDPVPPAAPAAATLDDDDAGAVAVDPWSVFDFASFTFGNEADQHHGAGAGADDPSSGFAPRQQFPQGLGHWFHGHQQLMGLLDDDVIF